MIETTSAHQIASALYWVEKSWNMGAPCVPESLLGEEPGGTWTASDSECEPEIKHLYCGRCLMFEVFCGHWLASPLLIPWLKLVVLTNPEALLHSCRWGGARWLGSAMHSCGMYEPPGLRISSLENGYSLMDLSIHHNWVLTILFLQCNSWILNIF